jgi:hypothetical protein
MVCTLGAHDVDVSPIGEMRELIRFLTSNVGHPVVLDRDDCALLIAWLERAQNREEAVHQTPVDAG